MNPQRDRQTDLVSGSNVCTLTFFAGRKLAPLWAAIWFFHGVFGFWAATWIQPKLSTELIWSPSLCYVLLMAPANQSDRGIGGTNFPFEVENYRLYAEEQKNKKGVIINFSSHIHPCSNL